MNENTIVIKNLYKKYGKYYALCNVDLTIERGMFGLLGRNGAGKTTLMKTIATLLHKSMGSVTVCGIPIENAKEIRRIIGYLPQDFSMYPSMTVYEAMDYLGVLSGIGKAKREAGIKTLLEKVNLTEHKSKRIKQLSGGMKRRLGIAQALLHNPKVLIVDEPTAGLDPEERIRFRNLLCEVAEDRIVILSTHIVGDIEATCEKIAILNEGKLLFNGSVDALLIHAENNVFTTTINKSELPEYKAKYLVTNIHTGGKSTQIRFISDTEVIAAQHCEPNIEDAYMYCLHQNGIANAPDLEV